jgi:hypothetical protein
MKRLEDTFKKEHGDDYAILADLKQMVSYLEGKVKESAVMFYKVDNSSKQVAPGLTVGVGEAYEYPEDEALEWAEKTGLCLIPPTAAALDTKAFEKEICGGGLRPNFVTTKSVYSVKLASDLNKALKASEKPED